MSFSRKRSEMAVNDAPRPGAETAEGSDEVLEGRDEQEVADSGEVFSHGRT